MKNLVLIQVAVCGFELNILRFVHTEENFIS